MPMVTDRTEGMAFATLPMCSIRRFSIHGHVNKTKTIEYLCVEYDLYDASLSLSWIGTVLAEKSSNLKVRYERETASLRFVKNSWSELIPKKDQTKKKMTSKSGEKQVQKLDMGCLVQDRTPLWVAMGILRSSKDSKLELEIN
uniref:Uncharacterized protein n=1 Tax=Vitis vinifera TaxID=29760 RepID=F6HK67_VITVI